MANLKSAHVAKRVICALLVVGFIAALVIDIVTGLRAGQAPTFGDLVAWATGLPGAYIFGRYAFDRRGDRALGILPDPSERVGSLSSGPLRDNHGCWVKRIAIMPLRTSRDAWCLAPAPPHISQMNVFAGMHP